MASVRPLRAVALVTLPAAGKVAHSSPLPEREGPGVGIGAPAATLGPKPPRAGQAARTHPQPLPARREGSTNTLDGSWDRRLTRGLAQPDASLDLHGHTLNSAHMLLDQGLERAIARGDRVLLLVTGKPPRPESERPHARGAIRAAVADWLATSRFADRIAAVRNAHPRHGGAGALYIVLRRG